MRLKFGCGAVCTSEEAAARCGCTVHGAGDGFQLRVNAGEEARPCGRAGGVESEEQRSGAGGSVRRAKRAGGAAPRSSRALLAAPIVRPVGAS